MGVGALRQEGIANLKGGILAGTFELPTGGKEAIDVALKVLKGEQVPKNITLPSRRFTKENLDRGGELILSLSK